MRYDDFLDISSDRKQFFLKEKGMTSSPSKSLRRGYVTGVFYKSIFDEKES